jgi:hypothetical protein
VDSGAVGAKLDDVLLVGPMVSKGGFGEIELPLRLEQVVESRKFKYQRHVGVFRRTEYVKLRKLAGKTHQDSLSVEARPGAHLKDELRRPAVVVEIANIHERHRLPLVDSVRETLVITMVPIGLLDGPLGDDHFLTLPIHGAFAEVE